MEGQGEDDVLPWYCSMCRKKVDALGASAHIPVCYIDWCEKHRTKPYCTCPDCKGLQPHPQVAGGTEINRKRGSEGREPEPEAGEECSREPKKARKLDDLRLLGTRCCICEAKRSPKNCALPLIQGGGDIEQLCREKTTISFVEHVYSLSTEEVKELLGIPRERLDDLVRLYVDHCQQHIGRPPKLPPEAEIILVITFLRHHLVDVLLSALFGIQTNTTRHIRQRMLNFLYTTLKNRLSLGTSEQRRKHGVMVLDSMITFILDWSEQPVLSSNNAVYDSLFYSTKKKQHSINVLLVMDPKGKVLYLSPSYPGAVGDSDIVKATKKDWCEKLAKWEWGFGDQGFRGLEDLRLQAAVKTNRASFRAFSSIRIAVEMKFEQIKNWRAAREQIRIPTEQKENLLMHHHMVWTIVTVLTNEFLE